MLIVGAVFAFAAKVHAQSFYPQLGYELNFNQTDVMMGGGIGIYNIDWNASAQLSFKGRIGARRVIVEPEDTDLIFQFRERRYLLGIDLEKRFAFSDISASSQVGGYLQAFGGLSFGDYRGTTAKPPTGFGGSAGAGIYIGNPDIIAVKLGYVYLPLQTQSIVAHRISMGLNIFLL
jgi:hypothetical protein